MATASATTTPSAVRRTFTRVHMLRLVPVLLAMFSGLWSLRDLGGSSIVGGDAPRHAMNGVFILDMVRNWKVAHPVQYGYWYYSHLPALSLPYHPPLFPVFEAMVFSVVGVGTFGARLAVSIASAVTVLLLFRLICKTHDSPLLAFVVTATFCTLGIMQELSSMVMLEVPAMAFVLASLLFIVPEEEMFISRRSLGFGMLAALAIWTKQTIFLVVLPFVYAALFLKWRLLRRGYFWVNVSVVAASVLGLILLARQLSWNGINQSWAKVGLLQGVRHNSYFYLRHGVLGLVLVLLCLLTYNLPGGCDDVRRDRLYIAWLIAAILVLVEAPAYSARYLFFAIPPFLLLFYSGLIRLGRFVWPSYRWVVAALVCTASVAYGVTTSRVPCFAGPNKLAQLVRDSGYHRILFSGVSNGAFLFALRSDDASLSTIVIRGDKLPDETYLPQDLGAFVSKYGIDAVVLEHTSRPQPWDYLSPRELPFLSLQQIVPMTDSTNERSGSLSLYRVLNPAKVPQHSLNVPISVLGRDVELRF